MSSNAYDAFKHALTDVDNLIWFHKNEGGQGRGRRGTHFQSLNKSAIVLLCASLETYLEKVIIECADINVSGASNPDDLLSSIQKLIQSHVR